MSDGKRTVAVAGGTGLVGTRLVARLLARDDVDRVVAVVRRPPATGHAKLDARVVESFARDELDDALPKDLDDAYCALGTTMKKAGSRDAFRAVDHDAIVAFANAARAKGARRFLLVSSIGADPRSMTFYLRVKGETEDDVRAIGFDALHAMRPSFLAGERKDARAGERIGLAISGVLKPLLGRYGPIDADLVARAMVALAFSDRFGAFVHDTRAIEKLAADQRR